MKERTFVTTAAKWAKTVGYSRALRVGDHIYVSGTAAVGTDGKIVHPTDAYLQAKRCLQIIADALRELGGEPSQVIRTRMYVLNASHWEAVGRAHGELFGEVLPATTMVCTGFIDPQMLVEIEAEAIVG